MKGDNNRIAEIIPRAAIRYEVVGAYYDTELGAPVYFCAISVRSSLRGPRGTHAL